MRGGMNVYSMSDQILGFARNYKKIVNCFKKLDKPYDHIYQACREDLVSALKPEYFDPDEAQRFADAFMDLIDTSNPTYKYKGKG